jgi:hypothetical protein
VVAAAQQLHAQNVASSSRQQHRQLLQPPMVLLGVAAVQQLHAQSVASSSQQQK